jgi:CheY-like chemotaxis protein
MMTALDEDPAVPSSGEPPSLRGRRVLIVEDEPDARELLHYVLEDAGMIVTSVGTVPEALAALSAERPQILVSDVGLPGQDGYALLRAVRDLPAARGGGVVAVAVTALGRDEDRRNAIDAGFDVHLSKPVDPTTLLHVLAEAIAQYSG